MLLKTVISDAPWLPRSILCWSTFPIAADELPNVDVVLRFVQHSYAEVGNKNTL